MQELAVIFIDIDMKMRKTQRFFILKYNDFLFYVGGRRGCGRILTKIYFSSNLAIWEMCAKFQSPTSIPSIFCSSLYEEIPLCGVSDFVLINLWKFIIVIPLIYFYTISQYNQQFSSYKKKKKFLFKKFNFYKKNWKQ